MKILVVLPDLPYPLESGGNQAAFSMLEAMSQAHQVTLVCRGKKSAASKQFKKALPKVELLLFPYPGSKEDHPYPTLGYKGLRFKLLRYLAASFRRKYYRFLDKNRDKDLIAPEAARRHAQITLAARLFNPNHAFFGYVGQICANGGYDAVQVEFFEMLPVIYYLPGNIYKIFVHHELNYIRSAGELALFPDKTPADKAVWARERDAELSMLAHFNHIITLTGTDKDLLQQLLPDVKIEASPAVVKTKGPLPFAPCSKELVFTGSASHYPNLDGLLWFCQEVLPLLREIDQEFKVHVTGKWSPELQESLLKMAPELVFDGFVEDLSAFLNGKISIIPIRIGSGMRMKALDAIQASSPIVTTHKGIEGQLFTTEEDCLIFSDATGFAQSVARLSAQESLQEQLARHAFEKLSESYNPEQMIARRMEIYRQIENRNN